MLTYKHTFYNTKTAFKKQDIPRLTINEEGWRGQGDGADECSLLGVHSDCEACGDQAFHSDRQVGLGIPGVQPLPTCGKFCNFSKPLHSSIRCV